MSSLGSSQLSLLFAAACCGCCCGCGGLLAVVAWLLFKCCCLLGVVGWLLFLVGWLVGRFLGLCSYLYLLLCLSVCLPACLSVCLSVYDNLRFFLVRGCLCWVVCVFVCQIVCLPDCLFACLICPCCGVIVLCIVQHFFFIYFVPRWCASFTFNCWPFLAWSCLHIWPYLRGCCFCWLRSFIRRTSIACMSALAAHMIKYQPVVIKQQVVPLFHPLPRTPLNLPSCELWQGCKASWSQSRNCGPNGLSKKNIAQTSLVSMRCAPWLLSQAQ